MDKSLKFIAEIDQYELAARLIERGCHMKRSAGQTGKETIAEMRAAVKSGSVPAYILDDFEAMAEIAILYLKECLEAAQRPN